MVLWSSLFMLDVVFLLDIILNKDLLQLLESLLSSVLKIRWVLRHIKVVVALSSIYAPRTYYNQKCLLSNLLLNWLLWLLGSFKFIPKLMQFFIELLFLLLEAFQDVINIYPLSLTIFVSIGQLLFNLHWWVSYWAIEDLRLSVHVVLFVRCLESLNAEFWLKIWLFRWPKCAASPLCLIVWYNLWLKHCCIVQSVVNVGNNRLEMAWRANLIL